MLTRGVQLGGGFQPSGDGGGGGPQLIVQAGTCIAVAHPAPNTVQINAQIACIQSPWVTDIDADGHNLTNINQINGAPFVHTQWINGAGGAIYYSGGPVGIGTTSPQAVLSIGIAAYGASDVRFQGDSQSPTGAAIIRGHWAGQLFFFTGDGTNQSLYLLPGGAQFGTSTSTTNISVFGGIDAQGGVINLAQGSLVSYPLLRIIANTSVPSIIELNEAGGSSVDIRNNGSGDFSVTATNLIFQTTDGATPPNWAERMRITSSGNVGIGTTSPQVELDILGRLWVRNSYLTIDGGIWPGPQLALNGQAGQACRIAFQTPGNNVFIEMRGNSLLDFHQATMYTFYRPDPTFGSAPLLTIADTNTVSVGSPTANPNMAFIVNGSCQVANLGIGVAPGANFPILGFGMNVTSGCLISTTGSGSGFMHQENSAFAEASFALVNDQNHLAQMSLGGSNHPDLTRQDNLLLYSPNDLVIATNGAGILTPEFIFTRTGRLGVNTVTPAYAFEVAATQNNVARFTSTTNNCVVNLETPNSAPSLGVHTIQFLLPGGASAGAISTYPFGTVYIDNGGQGAIQIGSSNLTIFPAVHILASNVPSANTQLMMGDNPDTNGTAVGLRVQTWSGDIYWDYKTFAGGRVHFRCGAGNQPSPTGPTWMTVDATTGNVGIGTTTPGSRLSIVGLPTSPAGLSAGDIWNNAGILNIV